MDSVREAREDLGATIVVSATWERRENSAKLVILVTDARTDRVLRTAVALEPEAADILFRAALVHAQLKNGQAACTYLEKSVKAGVPLSDIENTADFDWLRKDPRCNSVFSSAAGTRL